ncbi:uncharacterized protein LOC122253602 isoform X2 [Penaeus japonicus]|uniref:uncharacterized protein LOC122253602 isoform X2 n=1 Tax=Penaeus japonicus TaxID=27405 RepID=UPI001C70B541|nr:uncharacterized protein LOC122253602 isoform X2 [Penaeus japonicus]
MGKGKRLLPKKSVSKNKTFETANLYLRWLDGGVTVLSQASRQTGVYGRYFCQMRKRDICVSGVRCGGRITASMRADALPSLVEGTQATCITSNDKKDACSSPSSTDKGTEPKGLRKIHIRHIASRRPQDRREGDEVDPQPHPLPRFRSNQEGKGFISIRDGFFLPVCDPPPAHGVLQPYGSRTARASLPQFQLDLENSPLRRLLEIHSPLDVSLCRRSGCLNLAERPGDSDEPPSPRACILLSPWNTQHFVPESPSQFLSLAESFLVD